MYIHLTSFIFHDNPTAALKIKICMATRFIEGHYRGYQSLFGLGRLVPHLQNWGKMHPEIPRKQFIYYVVNSTTSNDVLHSQFTVQNLDQMYVLVSSAHLDVTCSVLKVT